MSVLIETSIGDLVVDLFVDEAPNACKNFLKLCKIKYYNNCLFHSVQRDFIAQTGDPGGTGTGGQSVWGVLQQRRQEKSGNANGASTPQQPRGFFRDELNPSLTHDRKGLLGMASSGKDANASQFYFTLGKGPFRSLDGRQTLFGKVAEGLEVLERLNEAPVDGAMAAASGAGEGEVGATRPCRNVRIRHTIVLDDPFDDPDGLEALIPLHSPPPAFDAGGRLEDDWRAPNANANDDEPDAEADPEAAAARAAKKEAQQRAVVLEMVGDLPSADAAPPDTVLFVCKLNPATQDEDLEIIFSRFGKVVQCDIVRDRKTGDSLCYGFIGFETKQSAEKAYFHMDGASVDDRLIRVDFSQSVGHLWRRLKREGKGGGSKEDGAAAAAFGGGGGGGRGRGRGRGVAAAPGAAARPGSRWGPPLAGAAAGGGGGRYIAVAPTPAAVAAPAPAPAAAAPPAVEEEEGERERRRERRRSSRSRSRSRSRSPRDRDRDHRHRHHHHRSSSRRDRSRSRERERDRDRDRHRHRRRSRSRSRERERERERRDEGGSGGGSRRRSRSR